MAAHPRPTFRLLPQIPTPEALRRLDERQLPDVAAEVRAAIIDTVLRKGGHLGASLGVVELTVALHYIYNTPVDQVVWDVGHNAYGHKILTGRFDRFESIRQDGGLSGFLKRNESPYDTFGAGHASTSISAGLGFAIARDLRNESHKVVSVIGDGSMTGGLAFEGLNNAGQRRDTDYVVVLNDNSMSISPNTGALASYFSKMVVSSFYNERKGDIRELVQSLPAGDALVKMIHKMEGSVKNLIVPGKFFEELGFRYVGPIDGHDLSILVPMLRNVRELKGPILLHIKTVKGKGLPEAEKDQEWGHAPSGKRAVTLPWVNQSHAPAPAPVPSKVEVPAVAAPATPKPPKKYQDVFADTLIQMAREDDRIVGITAAMPTGTSLHKFAEIFPDRMIDVGIAEAHAVCSAASMAAGGLRPVCAIYSTFLQRAYDQIVHDVALQHLPVVFALDRAGLVGADGPTHHGAFDLSYLRCIPGLVLMAPKDEGELRHMIATSMTVTDGPVAIRYPRGEGVGADLTEGLKTLPIGVSEEIRSGTDTTIVGVGLMVQHALAAADLLAERGWDVGVVNLRYVRPLDLAMIDRLAAQHSVIISVEDNAVRGGAGSAICEALAERGHYGTVNVPFGLPDRFIDHGTPEKLYESVGLDPVSLANRIEKVLQTRAAYKPQRPGMKVS